MLPHVRSSTLSRRDRSIDLTLWVLFGVSVAMTLFWAFGPDPPKVRILSHSDKVFHALSFASIYGSYLLAAVWRPGRGTGPFVGTAVPAGAVLLAFGLLIELVQGELLSRDADLYDVAAEIVGMAIAVGVVRALGWRRRA
jgi:hypothetical protein